MGLPGRPKILGHVRFPPPSTPPPKSHVGANLGRTGLIIGASKAKNAQEADFEVKTRLAVPKLAQNDEKRYPTRKKIVEKHFFSPKIDLTGIV